MPQGMQLEAQSGGAARSFLHSGFPTRASLEPSSCILAQEMKGHKPPKDELMLFRVLSNLQVLLKKDVQDYQDGGGSGPRYAELQLHVLKILGILSSVRLDAWR